ncbi:MAG: Nramp family divalent metal transporter [Spirochaetes bacterium]|jgi:manganese transport protein|nr:Nramp family divalent metal transporter [Spirochaetota bacterium]
MKLSELTNRIRGKGHKPAFGGLEIFKYIGPGLLVTVGFIDPGNWAANISAGSDYGYSLLWVITLSTLMLILLQHNVAHLGIASGLCLAEAANMHMAKWLSRSVLGSAMAASVSTSLAEVLGAAIALNMLFGVPYLAGSVLTALFVIILLFTNSYRKIERWIIGFVSLIGLSYIYELSLVSIDWRAAAVSAVKPSFPDGSMLIIMSVLGAVVMPHNLFLHSEIIQSRQWNLRDEAVIKRQLDYEFLDTLFSMLAGWAINGSMILLAAVTFFNNSISVGELQQAAAILQPLLGSNAALVFALALLFSGLSSSITSGMAGGTIFAGLFGESYDISDSHSRAGVLISLLAAVSVIFIIGDPFRGLIISQMLLSIQLPVTIFTQVYLTSSEAVMGRFVNSRFMLFLLSGIGVIVTVLNIRLLADFMFR